jgi:tagaturonate reductase
MSLPTLNRSLLGGAEIRALAPDPSLLDLPEKAVQFGTGAFLRGFVDYFIDAANREGRFGGRVVAIGSTGSGRDQALNDQNGLYTLAIRGVEEGEVKEEYRIVSSLSRALASRSEWDEVLAVARNPEIELIFSNTTEVGITLDESDSPDLAPPRSFPGKLTRFLLERGRTFGFDPAKGVVVIPCELIEDNGDRLRSIVLTLAERWGVEEEFSRWVRESVPFCNTLVDRIVPGTPEGEHLERIYETVGYRDGMLTACEVYRLFAIQGDDALRRRLRFADADPGVLVTPDVSPFRERKVRLLNGTHTIMVPTALLCGLETVQQAVEDERVGAFTRRVLFEEIVPTLHAEGAREFARQVLDRFSNPFIRHALLDITLQATMKMRVRVVPTIEAHVREQGRVPEGVAFGFAMFLLLMRGEVQERARAAGHSVPRDDQAERFRALWAGADTDEAGLTRFVREVCADRELWSADLTELPGWVESVSEHLVRGYNEGASAALDAFLATAPASRA